MTSQVQKVKHLQATETDVRSYRARKSMWLVQCIQGSSQECLSLIGALKKNLRAFKHNKQKKEKVIKQIFNRNSSKSLLNRHSLRIIHCLNCMSKMLVWYNVVHKHYTCRSLVLFLKLNRLIMKHLPHFPRVTCQTWHGSLGSHTKIDQAPKCSLHGANQHRKCVPSKWPSFNKDAEGLAVLHGASASGAKPPLREMRIFIYLFYLLTYLPYNIYNIINLLSNVIHRANLISRNYHINTYSPSGNMHRFIVL